MQGLSLTQSGNTGSLTGYTLPKVGPKLDMSKSLTTEAIMDIVKVTLT